MTTQMTDAEMDALKDRLEELKCECSFYRGADHLGAPWFAKGRPCIRCAMLDALSRLRAEIAELRRDAERLDFVEENFYNMPIAKDPLGWHLIVGYPSLGKYELIGSFRAALDRAMLAAAPEPQPAAIAEKQDE